MMRICVLSSVPHTHTHIYETRIIVRPSDRVILACLTSEIVRRELFASFFLPNDHVRDLWAYKNGLLREKI